MGQAECASLPRGKKSLSNNLMAQKHKHQIRFRGSYVIVSFKRKKNSGTKSLRMIWIKPWSAETSTQYDKQQAWFDSHDYQRDDLEYSYDMLGVP